MTHFFVSPFSTTNTVGTDRAADCECDLFVISRIMASSTDSNKTLPQVPQAQPVREDDAESAKLCSKWVQTGLGNNKAIQFLLNQLEEMGCSPPDGFIQCKQCPQPQASGFGKIVVCDKTIRDFESATKVADQQKGLPIKILPEIFICQQYMESEIMTHKSMAHELIHAIDSCRTKMDPVNNCVHLACTEIRAENLSGECSVLKELPRMKNFLGHGGECVKRRAALSVRANPKCAARAEDYVEAAMSRCFEDYFPFDKHPNQLQS